MTATRPAAPADILIGRDDLARRVRELAAEVSAHYSPQREPLVVISVLKGATLFLADLTRHMSLDVWIDFMSISSYADRREQSGVVRILKDLDSDIAGRDVLIVEDIVDTGLTLTYLRRALKERNPRSLRTVTLLDKTARRIVPVAVEHTGFAIPDVFVVGYGLDFQGRYRNIPEILAVRDLARLANDPMLLVEDVFAARAPLP